MAVSTGLCLLVVAAACGERGQPSSAPTAVPSASTERPAAGDHELTLTHNGAERTDLLHAPPGYDPGRPSALVIALHFYPGTASSMRELAGLDALADKDNVLVAYPDGVGGGFNALVCCGSQDDVGFLSALTGHLVQTWQQRLSCRPSPKPSGVPGVTHTVASCADGSEVSVYTLPDMGHSWPGATAGQLAASSAGLSATDLMWEFFGAHPRRA